MPLNKQKLQSLVYKAGELSKELRVMDLNSKVDHHSRGREWKEKHARYKKLLAEAEKLINQ